MNKALAIFSSVIFMIFLACYAFLFFSSPTQSAYGESSASALVLGADEVFLPQSAAASGETSSDLFLPAIAFEPASDAVLNQLPLSEESERAYLLPVKSGTAPDPSVPSGHAIVMDGVSGQVIFSKGANERSPIASITKLMTALVFLDHNPGWDAEYTITGDDRVEGGRIFLYSGDRVRVKDLFYLSLVGSGNSETSALVKSTGLSEEEFVAAMNLKAQELGLENTSFAEPIGLSAQNVSTAYEVAKLAKAALASGDITNAVLSPEYRFQTLDSRDKRAFNTDALLDSFSDSVIALLGGKTGYTEPAGYCFAGKFQNKEGREIFSVVLGGSDINYRFDKTKELVDWAYGNFIWK